jgi:small subunit ribosomal protein S16
MLAIRLQRVGRKGFPVYRLAVQESQRHPSSGRVVAYVGSYNPHTKDATVQVELAQKYLDNGAQPSPRVVKLLKDAGVKLPSWVKDASQKSKTIRHADKLRRNRPAEESAPEVEETPAEEPAVEADQAVEAETTTEEAAEAPAEPVEEASEAEDK